MKSKQHKQGIEFEKHPLHTVPLGLGISCKAGVLCLNSFSGTLFFDVLIIGLLDLLVYGPDFWRSELKHYIQSWKDLGSNLNLVTRLPVTLHSCKYQMK